MLGPLYQSLVPVPKEKTRYCSKKNRKNIKNVKSALNMAKIEQKSKDILRKRIWWNLLNSHVDNVILSICIICFPFLEFSMNFYEFFNLSFENRVFIVLWILTAFLFFTKTDLKNRNKTPKITKFGG